MQSTSNVSAQTSQQSNTNNPGLNNGNCSSFKKYFMRNFLDNMMQKKLLLEFGHNSVLKIDGRTYTMDAIKTLESDNLRKVYFKYRYQTYELLEMCQNHRRGNNQNRLPCGMPSLWSRFTRLHELQIPCARQAK